MYWRGQREDADKEQVRVDSVARLATDGLELCRWLRNGHVVGSCKCTLGEVSEELQAPCLLEAVMLAQTFDFRRRYVSRGGLL